MKKVMWYILAVCLWIVVFPVTGITGWAFIISGPIVALASIAKFICQLFNIDISWLIKNSFNLGIFPDFLISILIGIILTIIGLLLWKLTKKIYEWLMLSKPQN